MNIPSEFYIQLPHKESTVIYPALLFKLIDTINDGVLILEEAGDIIFYNKKIRSIFEIPTEELPAINISHFLNKFSPVNLNKTTISIEEIFSMKNHQMEIFCKNDKFKCINIDCRILSDEECNFNGYIITIQDISFYKDITWELQKQNQELNTFTYKVSHDIKGPLSSMAGLINLIKMDPDPIAIKKYLGLLENCVSRLDTILLDLLELTRIQSGSFNKTEINIHSLVKEITAALTHLPNTKKIKILLEIPLDLNLSIEKNLLSSILQNVIVNAINYHNGSTDEPYVYIRATLFSKNLIIEITDNGPGIDDTIKEKVFDMFFRGMTSVEGSGLGLYIVKNAVKKLKGEIKLQSNKYEGTAFTITLPITKEQII